MTAVALTAAALGLGGCATTQAAAPQPTQDLPLTGSAVATAAPPEWAETPPEWSAMPSDQPSAPPSPTPPKAPTGDIKVLQVVRKVARTATAAAVVVYDRDSGSAVLSETADRQFYAGSLIKLLVGVDALTRHPGDTQVRRDITYMIQRSDDTLCSKYWVSEGGGAAIIGRMRQRMGLKQTKPPADPGRWGNAAISANDMVRIYDYILDEAPPAVRLAILEGMASATEYGSDGVRQWFGIPSGMKPNKWAIKQGWTTSGRGQLSMHSTGLVGDNWRYVVVLLTEHPEGSGWDSPGRSVTAAAVAAAQFLK
nr:possible lipoprotein [Kibdelosporangium sp. MJ126-NF4]CTQ95727.1 possible lipoprotein [Kibdelosporangium sp. MJ126-NF4]